MTAAAVGDGGEAASLAAGGVVEVEKKIFLTASQREALQASLPQGRERSFWDVYFDGPGHPLTCRDWWLRRRDGAWALKVPVLEEQVVGNVQSFEEVEDCASILRELVRVGFVQQADGADSGEALQAALDQSGIVPFGRLHTQRVSIALEACRSEGLVLGTPSLDLDTVTFDATYAEPGAPGEPVPLKPFMIAEVEIMVPKGRGAEAAAGVALHAFLAEQGLADAPEAYSKLLEYLLLYRPGHLEDMIAAGVVSRARLQRLRAVAASRPG